MRVAVLLAGVMVGGCCLKPPAMAPDVFVPATGVLRRAVVAGLTAVDRSAYGGWGGACPGSDVDADVFGELCRERGLQVAVFHNAAATRAALEAAARAACRGMKEGDLLVLYVSGHGGQVNDGDTTEADELSETLCLWDGQMTDTYLSKVLGEVPAGVRVFFVTDTCNSGTNYRRRSYVRAMPAPFQAAMIHYGGCADGANSMGGPQGGVFTTALIDAWSETGSYRSWFTNAAARMPQTQVAVYEEYGAVTDGFRNGRALE
ncbi:MAG: caspase family protein [Kiritimatiellae bacterium]|nr:caspase family protein [Kiritimatiellia bacterium]